MKPLIFLDLETTGMDSSRDHIIEVACIRWQDGKILDRYESLVNPHIPIPHEITLLTGIRDEDVKMAPSFSEVRDELYKFIGDSPVVGHNIPFDTGFLKYHHAEFKNPEIDTLSLARILLHREASYALEVLMKKYNLPARESHRAMADTETCLSFFEFLLEKIPQIPDRARPLISQILEKSQWSGKEIFIELLAQKTTLPTAPVQSEATKESLSKARSIGETWTSEITKRFLSGEKILYETSREIPMSNFEETVCIAYGSFPRRNELLEKAALLNVSVHVLKEPHFYLSPKKLHREIAAREKLGPETPFFLKMASWEAVTETGDREEISLEREEFGLFETVSDEAGEDIFWQKNLDLVRSGRVALIHHGGLVQGLSAHLGESFKSLIIDESAKLEDSITNSYFTRFSERMLHAVFGDRVTVLFGLIGIFYKHYAEEGYDGFLGNVTMTEHLRTSKLWQNVLDCAANLPDHELKEKLLATLKNEDANIITWINSWNDEVSIQTCPVNLSNIFHTSVEPFKNVLLQDLALSGDSTFGLIKRILDLDDSWKTHQDDYRGEWNLERVIPENFPEPNTEGYFKKCLNLFSEIIDSQKGRAIFLVNSKKSVEAFYSALLPFCQARDVKLIGAKISGGTGKTTSIFLNNPNRSILIATAQILPYLDNVGEHVDTVVFQKIAFDPPDNPIFKSRSELFSNGFMNYSLPRAIMKFRALLSSLNKQGVKKCYVLDKRIQNREYGALFV